MNETGQVYLVRPWIEYGFLNFAPTDPWWGFHIILAGFISIFGIMWGVKVMASAISALIITVFFLFLKTNKIKQPLVWLFLFFASSLVFQFRLVMERPHLISILLTIVFVLFLGKKKYWGLFIVSALYVLFYQLWFLALLIVFFYGFIEYLYLRRIDLKITICVLGGVLLGLIIHPQTLNFIYVSLLPFKILFLKFAGVKLYVAEELQFIGLKNFLKGSYIAIVFYLLVISFFWSRRKRKEEMFTAFLFWYSFFWFIISYIIPRGTEYWVPLAWMFMALSCRDFFTSNSFTQVKKFIRARVNTTWLGIFVIGIILSVFIGNSAKLLNIINYENNRYNDISYQEAGEWLRQNTFPGEIIFYPDWSMWPRMFYFDSYNHYIVGMDPTFLYEYDKRLAALWTHIAVEGKYCASFDKCDDLDIQKNNKKIAQAIKSDFKSRYIILEKETVNKNFYTLMKDKNNFQPIFNNSQLEIYEVK